MDLVRVKRNEVFTDSLIVAEGTGNAHESVIKMIRKYIDKFETLGKMQYSDYLKSEKLGTTGKMCLLNEPQATFLMTLLSNKDVIVEFKLKLTKKFYRMRTALMERQTTEWLQTRQKGKLVRRKETDVLARLKIYAEEQRDGKPYPNVYTNYTKLVNDAVGIATGERNIATFKQLQMVSLLEDMVQHTVIEEMEKGVFFKEIYKKCRSKVNTFVSLMYLDTDIKQLNSAS